MAGFKKNLKRSRRDVEEDDASSADDAVTTSKKPTKKTKTVASGEEQKDDSGNAFWALSATRRITVSDFKGKTFVNIREYWTDASGDLKPGKKGISLSVEQYECLLKAIPTLNSHLRDQGHELPDLGSAPALPADEERSEQPSSPKEAKTGKGKAKKANIEATSDEESE